MPPTSRRTRLPLAALLLASLALRLGVAAVQFDALSIDRDGYREIAGHLADGAGYSHAVGDGVKPTAYRPPLYPLLLAVLFRLGAGDAGLAAVQVLLGVGTVLLTYAAGVRLGLGHAAYVAAGLVAVDPLLLQYTALSMTEVLCTFLIAWLLLLIVGTDGPHPEGEGAGRHPSRSTRLRWALLGAVFGLCLLCRPTIGAFGLLGGLCWLGYELRQRRRRPLCAWPAVLSAAVVISPWLLRNLLVLGHPIATTTHGGYTLLLGNNPVFYREVVGQPWGTVWDDAPAGRTQGDWLRGVEADLRRDLGPLADDESSRDRWMYRQARRHIAAEPGLFLRACLLRFLRFWNVVPLAPARAGVPPAAVRGVGLFYAVEIALFLVGTVLVVRRRQSAWFPLLLAIAAFSAVHLFYWSNMRMRAPVIPAIALVGALAVSRTGKPALR